MAWAGPLPAVAGQSLAGWESPGRPVPVPASRGSATGAAGSEAQETESGGPVPGRAAPGSPGPTWAPSAGAAGPEAQETESGGPVSGRTAPSSLTAGSA